MLSIKLAIALLSTSLGCASLTNGNKDRCKENSTRILHKSSKRNKKIAIKKAIEPVITEETVTICFSMDEYDGDEAIEILGVTCYDLAGH